MEKPFINEQINSNLKKPATWQRIFFMLIFSVIVSILSTLLWTVMLLQIFTSLLTGSSNPHILIFSRSLAAYLYHITLYLTFNTEVLPFPFSQWQVTKQFDVVDITADSHN